jgi:hypothetical protein
MARKKSKKNQYWAEEQENAIKEYNTSNDVAYKHMLYETVILAAFKKLVENIFYTYNFNKILGDLNNVENDVMIHLYEKIVKFDHTKGFKSFSFFGTITKNWMIQQSNAAKKKVSISDENDSTHVNNISLKEYDVKEESIENKEFISILSGSLEEYDDEEIDLTLNDDDKSVIEIICSLLNNYELYNIYNKKQVYVFIREGTGLPSRKVTRSLKKIRMMYGDIRKEFFK